MGGAHSGPFPEIIAAIVAVFAVFLIVREIWSQYSWKKLSQRVSDAEINAYGILPTEITDKKDSSKNGDESAGFENAAATPTSNDKEEVETATLRQLYSAQIESYEQATLNRAQSSFGWAIFAMFAGLGIITIGGYLAFNNPDWAHSLTAAAFSGIGGVVGAYLAKTFLEVHRLSLNQFNRQLQQPILKAHILDAQRIADRLDDRTAKQRAYEAILASVIALIHDQHNSP
ncbi:MAG TPA: hypothetical protein VIE65_06735, partial [Methylobacter sp.]